MALAMLEEYDWPGNVRELRNIVRCAAVHTSGPVIEPQDLPDYLRLGGLQTDAAAEPAAAAGDILPLEEMKRRYAHRAVERFGGVKSKAAGALGITPHTLRRLLRERGSSP